MNIVPFQNDSFKIRTITDGGKVLFVAKDILSALQYSEDANVGTTVKAVPDEWKGRYPITTPGGIQHMVCLSEEGLYFFLGRSDKQKSLPLQKWIAGDVLPSIRKTGSYSVAPKQIASESIYMIAHQVLMTVPGLDHALAASATLRMIEDNTGVTTESMRKALPRLKESAPTLNATLVGEPFGVPPRTANLMLSDAGLQAKNSRGEWEVTDAGRKYGGMVPFTNNGHSGYQPLWRPEVIDFLRSIEMEVA